MPAELVESIAEALLVRFDDLTINAALSNGAAVCAFACVCRSVSSRLQVKVAEAVQTQMVALEPIRDKKLRKDPFLGLVGCKLRYVIDKHTRYEERYVEGSITEYNPVDFEATVVAPEEPTRPITLLPRQVCVCSVEQRPPDFRCCFCMWMAELAAAAAAAAADDMGEPPPYLPDEPPYRISGDYNPWGMLEHVGVRRIPGGVSQTRGRSARSAIVAP